jgi:hypothetical protein
MLGGIREGLASSFVRMEHSPLSRGQFLEHTRQRTLQVQLIQSPSRRLLGIRGALQHSFVRMALSQFLPEVRAVRLVHTRLRTMPEAVTQSQAI